MVHKHSYMVYNEWVLSYKKMYRIYIDINWKGRVIFESTLNKKLR